MKMKGEGKEEKENITREDRREEGSVHFFDSHAVRFSLVGRNEKQQLGHSSPQLRPSFGIRSTNRAPVSSSLSLSRESASVVCF